MRENSEIDFTISVFLFCTFEDFSLILMRLSTNSKNGTGFVINDMMFAFLS